jgi:hypothetical protein
MRRRAQELLQSPQREIKVAGQHRRAGSHMIRWQPDDRAAASNAREEQRPRLIRVLARLKIPPIGKAGRPLLQLRPMHHPPCPPGSRQGRIRTGCGRTEWFDEASSAMSWPMRRWLPRAGRGDYREIAGPPAMTLLSCMQPSLVGLQLPYAHDETPRWGQKSRQGRALTTVLMGIDWKDRKSWTSGPSSLPIAWIARQGWEYSDLRHSCSNGSAASPDPFGRWRCPDLGRSKSLG